MMKRLFWKELRENRMIPIWIAMLLGLLTTAARMMADIPPDLTVWYLYTAWGLAGVFTAAGAISREVGNGTLAFLLAQPVSRRAVWWAKWLSGIGILIASIIATSLTWAAVQHGLYGPDAFGRQIRQELGDWAVWAALASVTCYAVAWSLSALLDRAISAAMLALVVCGAMFIPITLITGHYQAVPRDDTANIILFGFACLPAFACASYAAFSRGEAMRNRRRLLWAAAGWLGGLIAAGIVFLALCSFVNRFQSREVFIDQWHLSHDGRYFLLTALNAEPRAGDDGVLVDDYRIRRLVVESVSGPPFHRVLPSGDPVAWSPDGRYLLYQRDGAPFGLISTQSTPVCVDIRTGGECRLDLPPVQLNRPLRIVGAAWSPDGKWLAVQTQDNAALNRIFFFRRADIPMRDGLWRPWSSVSNSPSPDLYSAGGPERETDCFGYGQSIPWSNDSRGIYFTDGREFAIVVPTASAGRRFAMYDLCRIPPQFSRLDLVRSRGDHRVLLTYPTGNIANNWNPSNPYNRGRDNCVIDLAAATAAARAHPSLPTPGLKVWTRRWSSAAIPPAWRSAQLTISPDGRYLMQPRELPHKPKARRRFIASVLDLNAPGRPSWQIPVQYLPSPDGWLSDGRRFLDYYAGDERRNAVVDVRTGERDTIPLRGRTILRPLAGNRLLLANLKSPDVLHIKFDVVKM
ncbi:MAG TPA: ABC transporter permease subunit [Armatimonadota bacterium]|nr:ABC transporter permease subunit [Armatimonadota bacterium]